MGQMNAVLRHYCNNKERLTEIMKEGNPSRYMNAECLKVVSVVMETDELWKDRDRYLNEEREEYDMCKGRRDLIEDGRAEGYKEGAFLAICRFVRKGLIKPEEAAKELNLTTEDFLNRMKALAL